LFGGVGQAVRPCQYAMPESPLLFSSVVPACGFCLQVQSRGRGVKESRSWEANRRPDLSGRSLGRRWAIPRLPDSSISRPRNLASELGRHDSEKHKNNTNEASMLLKTQGAFGKRTQNELNFERQMHRLNPNSELSSAARVRAGGLHHEMRKGTEEIGSGDPGATRENTKNSMIEASMLLKTKEGVGKRTQNELNFECQMGALIPKSRPSGSSSNSHVPGGARDLAPGLPVSKYPGRARLLALTCRKPRPSRANGNLPSDAIYVG